jgi:glutamate synthase (NADPH/NADH) large chain
MPHRCGVPRNDSFDRGDLAEQMLADMKPHILAGTPSSHRYTLDNARRSIGARVSGEIARHHGNHGMDATPITVRMTGTAGQSFGVWNAGGLNLYLEGEANDYVGKGMAGGRIVIYPPPIDGFESHANVIMGNTCLYGATGGVLYGSGIAGERFAVRNSGATAIVEGVGDHCCEYMTGGIVVVLGRTGVNLGAAMTGGLAFVLDLDDDLVRRCNSGSVELRGITGGEMAPQRGLLRDLLADFARETGSPRARVILAEFSVYAKKFRLVIPRGAEPVSLPGRLHSAA